jgi:hypothetical protein
LCGWIGHRGGILCRGIAGRRGRGGLGGGGLRSVHDRCRVDPGRRGGVRGGHLGRRGRRDGVGRGRGRGISQRGDRGELRRERVVRPCGRGCDCCDRGEKGHGRCAGDGRAIEMQAHSKSSMRFTCYFHSCISHISLHTVSISV